MQSHTGSGKTMAYLLPVIMRILADQDKPENERPTDVQCLVVVPSQELAMQIVRQMERVLGEFGKAITQQCIGGANVRRQEEAIRRSDPSSSSAPRAVSPSSAAAASSARTASSVSW